MLAVVEVVDNANIKIASLMYSSFGLNVKVIWSQVSGVMGNPNRKRNIRKMFLTLTKGEKLCWWTMLQLECYKHY